MNAYEKRKLGIMEKRKAYNKRMQHHKTFRKKSAEKYYEDAFIALQGKPPLVIPKTTADKLIYAANLMYAKIHEQELYNDTLQQ